jgi:hypothetical protein
MGLTLFIGLYKTRKEKEKRRKRGLGALRPFHP